MKLLFLFGNAAVGKMTVGQELAQRTGLRLFHNHIMIEPVLEVFGFFQAAAIRRLRDVIFEEFAASDAKGMIFTFMWAYIEHVKEIFLQRNKDTEFYYAELVASQEVRLQRNVTENRLRHKPSKRNLEASMRRLMDDDERFRLESREGEIPFEKYIKLDNTELSPAEAAARIQDFFHL